MKRETDVRVLVTGASGFLGRHVVAALEQRDLEVIATGRRQVRGVDHLLDLRDRPGIQRVLREYRPDYLVNCAAYGVNFADQDSQEAVEVNVLGSLALMESAAEIGVVRFLQVGSCSEYGSHPGLIAEDVALKPSGVYGASKAAASLALIERARVLKVSLMVARPFGIWGPGEGQHRLVPQIVSACRYRVPLDLTPCDVVRDYTYVKDMARNLVALLMVDDWGSDRVVNLGSGRPMVLRDFVLRIATHLGGAELMCFGRLPHRPGELASLVADTGAMRRLLGETRETSLSEGMRCMKASQPTPV